MRTSNSHADPWATGTLPTEPGTPDKRRTKRVLSFEGGTPGYFLGREYRIGRNPYGSYWILWESIEDESATSMACVTFEPVACTSIVIGEAVEASKVLLQALWTEHAKIYDQPNCMDSFTADGLLSKREIEEILKDAWPDLRLDELCGSSSNRVHRDD